MTTLTPPPLPPAPTTPTPPAPQERPPHPAARVVAILAIVFGGLIVLGAATAAIIGGLAAAAVHTETRTVTADGIADLDIDVSAGEVVLEYGDVDDVTLEVTSSRGADAWTLERDGDTLTVQTPNGFFGFGWIFGGNGRAVITLPAEYESRTLDAALDLSAGDLTVSGTFGDLKTTVSAGSLDVEGSASSLQTDVSAGSADLAVSGVADADLAVSAGELIVALTERAPRDVVLDVSAGSLTLTVPDGTYDVNVSVSAGELHNHLDTSSTATSTITGEVSAGDAVLRAGR
ncbi:DUF4097 family beta strand repeat-containing protein [Microbacterium terricola]|uniref:DUF4097 domain-containing protein n=1 Tax=Microbacterium terricola TaxID=344163 RepID=A0ABM8E2X4_9MICO|nr:DUF4097 family beta strand repeat-containing protein [Microbacterium terricola]UYK40222.1 DUF4097 family beta strand repeat-containing protein [Microbacterium terricola]BDV32071.1 hypothetical protein Microterr_27310 [Microbacterium terricola]